MFLTAYLSVIASFVVLPGFVEAIDTKVFDC